MAQKITPNRNYLRNATDNREKIEGSIVNGEVQERINRYFMSYAKANYRTIGFKLRLNDEMEQQMLDYLDYQPAIKTYFLNLIAEDMKKHPDVVAKAVENAEFFRQHADEIDIPKIRPTDWYMTCPECGHKTVITNKTYKKTRSTGYICPKCEAIMNGEHINPNRIHGIEASETETK